MELVVTVHDDGTFGLAVDGVPYTEADEAETLFARDSVKAVLADARVIFGGHADSVVKPEPVPPTPPDEPDPAPATDPLLENFDPAAESPGPAPPAEPTAPVVSEPQPTNPDGSPIYPPSS